MKTATFLFGRLSSASISSFEKSTAYTGLLVSACSWFVSTSFRRFVLARLSSFWALRSPTLRLHPSACWKDQMNACDLPPLCSAHVRSLLTTTFAVDLWNIPFRVWHVCVARWKIWHANCREWHLTCVKHEALGVRAWQ